jgi:hypothetical protein
MTKKNKGLIEMGNKAFGQEIDEGTKFAARHFTDPPIPARKLDKIKFDFGQ